MTFGVPTLPKRLASSATINADFAETLDESALQQNCVSNPCFPSSLA